MNPHDIDRHIDLALRREPDAGPPADFAASVASLARERAADPAIERWLLRALVAVLVLAGVAVTALYGRQWLPAFDALPLHADPSTLHWVAAMLACLALTWVLGRAGPRSVR